MSWTLKQQVMKVTVIMTVSQVVPRIYTVRPERNFRMSSFFLWNRQFLRKMLRYGCTHAIRFGSTQSFFEQSPIMNSAERKRENVKRISQQNDEPGK